MADPRNKRNRTGRPFRRPVRLPLCSPLLGPLRRLRRTLGSLRRSFRRPLLSTLRARRSLRAFGALRDPLCPFGGLRRPLNNIGRDGFALRNTTVPSSVPDVLAKAIHDFEETAPGTPWAFWARWYRGMLEGKPLDWELQRRVALIDDAIWEAGPEAVAQEIARIERLFELEQEIAALKATLPPRSTLSLTSLIGDNGGPPLDDGVQQAVRGDFVLVWDQIEELEAEIAKPEPSPGRLKAIAKTLWDLSLRFAAYCGGKIDLALTEASKEAGKAAVKWGAPIVVTSLAAQNEGIQQVAKAIWAVVKTLPPG